MLQTWTLEKVSMRVSEIVAKRTRLCKQRREKRSITRLSRANQIRDPGPTDHCPIHFLQCRSTPKAIVNTRDETSRDEENDANVVQLIPNLVDHRRMIRDGVISRAHA